MGGILGHARVRTGNQDVVEQRMRMSSGDLSHLARDNIVAARAKGNLPGGRPRDGDLVSAAAKRIAASISAEASRPIARSTVYREMERLRVAPPV